MSDLKSKIIKGSFIDIFGTLLATIVSFVVIRLYFQVITKDEFGLWLAINGVASLIALVDLGIDQYFTTLISSDGTFFHKNFNTDLSNTIIIKIFIAVFFSILGLLMFIFLANIINIQPGFVDIAKITFGVNVVYLILNIFFNSANSVLLGRNHFSLVNSVIIISSISSSLFTYFLIKSGYGIISFPLALLAMAVLQFGVLFYFVKKKYPHIRFGKVNLKGKREMISYSFSFQLLKWSYIIRNQYIIIAINNYAGPSFVTLYNMTNKIPQMLPAYFSKIVMPFFPSFARYVNEGDYESIRNVVIKVTKVLFRYALFFGIALYFFNKSFVYLWVGKDKYAGADVEIWLIVYMIALSAFCGFGIIIFSTKKFEKWTLFSVVEIFVVIILSYVFNKYYGFYGIIAGFVIGSIPVQFYTGIIALRQIGLDLKNILYKMTTYVLVPNVLSVFIGTVMIKLVNIQSWFMLISMSIIYTLFHFAFYEGVKFLFSKEKGFKNRLINSFTV